jgi:hypothetical protein
MQPGTHRWKYLYDGGYDTERIAGIEQLLTGFRKESCYSPWMAARSMAIPVRRFAVWLAILLFLQTGPAHAEVIPGKWQKVDLLQSGSPIILKTVYGEILDCIYFSSSDEMLLVVESVSKQQRRIPKASVEKITAKEYDDPLLNGGLIGISIGAGLGVAFTSLSDTARHRNSASDRVIGCALFGLLGMGVGALVDFKHRAPTVVYEAPRKVNR